MEPSRQIKELYLYMLKRGGRVEWMDSFKDHKLINITIENDTKLFSIISRTIMLGECQLLDRYAFYWPNNRYFGSKE